MFWGWKLQSCYISNYCAFQLRASSKRSANKRIFRAVNQMFCISFQLTTTAEHCFIVWTVHNNLITARSAVVGSWEEPPNIWLRVAKNTFVGWALNFRVCRLLKGAVVFSTCSLLLLPTLPFGLVFNWWQHSLKYTVAVYSYLVS